MRISFKDILLEESEDLKKELTQNLRNSRPIVNKFLVSQYRQRRLIININSESQESYTEIYPDLKVKKINYKIILGLKEINPGVLDRKIFKSSHFDERSLIEYKLLHEICHCIYNELILKNNPYLKSLIGLSVSQNQKDKRFFTLYGSFNGSVHKENLEVEDITELLTMYLWDVKYFTKYIQYAINPIYENERKMFSIRTLNTNTANVIINLIEKITASV